jgi:signal transduction histidine kinase/DNA-binding NarL/FixJ family response regulator
MRVKGMHAPPRPQPVAVLLVEDNPGDARLIRTILREPSNDVFQVERVDRLSAGQERLRAGGIDVVLLDLGLPDSSALDTFRSVHAAAPDVPVVVLSVVSDDALALEAVHEGAQDYLAKGQTDGEVLRRVLRHAIERGRLLAREHAARAEAEAARQRVAVLADAGEILVRSLDYEAGLRQMGELLVQSLAGYCSVVLLEEDGSLRRVAAVASDLSHADRRHLHLERLLPPGDRHPAWQVLRTGKPAVFTDPLYAVLETMVHDARHLALFRSLDSGSAVCVPMLARGEALGTILLIWPKLVGHKQSDLLDLAKALAHRAALAIDNARLHQDLEHALRGRDAFFAAVTHDLRNPLASITLWIDTLELLKRRLESGSDEQASVLFERAVNQIEAQVGRSMNLIDDLLDVARLEAGQPVPLNLVEADLNAIAAQALEGRPAQSKHALRLESTETEVRGQWDADRLGRVLDNLISNAIKYTPEAGHIVVRVSRHETPGQAWAILEVQDRGVGIPAADLPHIFERFHRARNVASGTPGTGLGLWGSRQIVEQHGGTLSVISREGEGTTVTVRLPLPADARAQPARTQNTANGRRTRPSPTGECLAPTP